MDKHESQGKRNHNKKLEKKKFDREGRDKKPYKRTKFFPAYPEKE